MIASPNALRIRGPGLTSRGRRSSNARVAVVRTSASSAQQPSLVFSPTQQRWPGARGSTAPLRPTVCRSTAVESSDSNTVEEDLPEPVIVIDNEVDEAATFVKVEFGKRLGLLLDTVEALSALDLSVTRATVETMSDESRNHFFITTVDGNKVTDTNLLEDIRLTILNNLVSYHPESLNKVKSSLYQAQRSVSYNRDVPTIVRVRPSADGKSSSLFVCTADRPGLLVEIVKELKDMSINVLSAEIDTIGDIAKDEFILTAPHKPNEPLSRPMGMLIENALMYYLAKPAVEKDESY
mmetsp:Transcript_4412/g.15803  ORF Transcript_4412/g.15803 Transcript_4412/m.15803 type:complete len:295 (+) Transcript_4412:188-1072(+)